MTLYGVLYVIFQNVVSWLLLLFGIGFPLFLIFKAIGLTGFGEITKFESHNTFYYKLNPLTLLIFAVVVSVVAAVTIWWIGLLLTLGLMASYLTLRNGRRKFMLGFYLTLVTIIGRAWSIAPYTPPIILEEDGFKTFTTIWVWPSYFMFMGYEPHLTLQALIYGVQTSMRFTAVLLAGLLLILTSTPSKILRAFGKMGVPNAIIFGIVVAMRTLPRVFYSMDVTMKVQLMRGRGAGWGKRMQYFAYLSAGLSSLFPVMVFLMRGARNIALAADTRAFRAYPKRTYLNDVTFSKYDTYMAVIIVGLLIAAVVANILGFGRGLPYVVYNPVGKI